MSYARPKQFTSWSYGRWRDWYKCPLFAKLKHLDKLPEPGSPAMERGSRIDDGITNYLRKTKGAKLPSEVVAKLRPMYESLRKERNLFVNEMWGFDRQWQPVAWNDWDRCWLRVKVDMGHLDLEENVLYLFDNKTGRYKPEETVTYGEQNEIYTAGGAAQFSEVDYVVPRFVYTDHGILHPPESEMIDQRQAGALQKKWTKKVQPMFADKRFNPKPGRACQWCPYSKAKNGPCKY
jgi:hypothetical protein